MEKELELLLLSGSSEDKSEGKPDDKADHQLGDAAAPNTSGVARIFSGGGADFSFVVFPHPSFVVHSPQDIFLYMLKMNIAKPDIFGSAI